MNEELLAKCGCMHCGNHIAFPIEAAGAQINCPHCGELTELSLLAPPGPEWDKPSAADLVAAFSWPVPRNEVSIFYQMAAVLVALMMVLLPLAYVLLIATAAYGVYSYGSHFASLLHSFRGGVYFYLVKVMIYFAPLFSGTILVLFMIKPLFARRARHAQPLAMNPALEPALYAFIAKICALVGAPMPQRIDLVCELNAAASFRRGAASLLANDLVLTIGLPLVAGLNLREMAGVIAHEFGHFTQGFGMRLSYLIRRINGWFVRVVYERGAKAMMRLPNTLRPALCNRSLALDLCYSFCRSTCRQRGLSMPRHAPSSSRTQKTTSQVPGLGSDSESSLRL